MYSFDSAPSEVRNWIGRQLFDYSLNSIAVIDRGYKVVLANRRFVDTFGQFEGKYCYEVYKGQSTPCQNCSAALTFDDGKMRVNDEQGMDNMGRPAHYVVNMAPVYNEVGEVTHIMEMSYDITETKALQREYNILFERVPCYIAIINRDLRIVRANELLRERFGDVVGNFCYRVLKRSRVACNDCPALRTFRDGKTYQSEQLGINKRGQKTNYIVSTAPLSRTGKDFSHVIEMSLDVTDIRTCSHKLEQELQFRNVLAEHAPSALIAVDEEGIINIFNPTAEKLLDISAADVIGKSKARRFLPAEFLTAMDEGKTSLSLFETEVTDRGGNKIPVSFFGTVLHYEGEGIGGAVYLQDLRELKRLEKEKLESERLASVGQTVAQLAHGIKNILTGLHGGMYVIRTGLEKESKPRTHRGLGMLERNVKRITTLVRGFLNYSKGHKPQITPTDPNTILQEIFELYYESVKEKKIDFHVQKRPFDMTENLDPEDMYTCLSNLVSNAIDACITADNKKCRIDLRLKDEQDSLVFEVEDTGCGMDEQTRQKVFNSFFTTKGMSGTGLGLLVTRKLIQEHGGTIHVASEEDKGSLFRIVLPRSSLPDNQ